MFERELSREVEQHLIGIPPAAQQAFRAARDVLRALGRTFRRYQRHGTSFTAEGAAISSH